MCLNLKRSICIVELLAWFLCLPSQKKMLAVQMKFTCTNIAFMPYHIRSRVDTCVPKWLTGLIGWLDAPLYLVITDQLSEEYRCNKMLNILRPRKNGRHFPDDIFKCIFLNENVLILNKISLKFVPKGQINNITALVQIMAWRRPYDKPLSEPRMESLVTHICVTRPRWVKHIWYMIFSQVAFSFLENDAY